MSGVKATDPVGQTGHETLDAWLEAHQLSTLLPILRQHDVDKDILHDLTPADLVEMGLSLGDRKRLMKALGIGAEKAGQAPPAPKPGIASAERRQITVLFCDLVGSSRLTAMLDPEESRSIIRGYRAVVAAEVERLGGHVAQYLGDGVLAYFGWPLAQEDAAHRAVAAGLAIIEAVENHIVLQQNRLAIRLGAATGMVVIGASDTDDMTEDMTAVGDVVNIAARLQEHAQPNAIVIAGSTRLLVGDVFELKPLGQQSLKGIAEPVALFSVEGHALASKRRPDAPATGSGREEEMKTGTASLVCRDDGSGAGGSGQW